MEDAKSGMTPAEEEAYLSRVMKEANDKRLKDEENERKAQVSDIGYLDLFSRPVISDKAREDAIEMLRENVAESSAMYDAMCSTSDLDSASKLIERLEAYIKGMYRLESRAVRLLELNRRFGMAARRLGMTVRGAMSEVTKTGRIGGRPYKSVFVYCDEVQMNVDVWEIPLQIDKDKHKMAIFERAFASKVK